MLYLWKGKKGTFFCHFLHMCQFGPGPNTKPLYWDYSDLVRVRSPRGQAFIKTQFQICEICILFVKMQKRLFTYIPFCTKFTTVHCLFSTNIPHWPKSTSSLFTQILPRLQENRILLLSLYIINTKKLKEHINIVEHTNIECYLMGVQYVH